MNLDTEADEMEQIWIRFDDFKSHSQTHIYCHECAWCWLMWHRSWQQKLAESNRMSGWDHWQLWADTLNVNIVYVSASYSVWILLSYHRLSMAHNELCLCCAYLSWHLSTCKTLTLNNAWFVRMFWTTGEMLWDNKVLESCRIRCIPSTRTCSGLAQLSCASVGEEHHRSSSPMPSKA